MAEIYIITEFMDAIPGVFGNRDENAIIIEDAFFVRVTVRNESVCISGDSEENCKRAESVLRRLIELAVAGEVITLKNAQDGLSSGSKTILLTTTDSSTLALYNTSGQTATINSSSLTVVKMA